MIPLLTLALTGWEKARAVFELALLGAEAWATVDERRQAREDQQRDLRIADLERQLAWAQMQAASMKPEPAKPARRRRRRGVPKLD